MSSKRKQALIGWSKNNAGYISNTQLQKFLFFYECFSKIDGDMYEMDGLKGYRDGPVFSSVFGDIKYDDKFKNKCGEFYLTCVDMVNEKRAKLSSFLVKTLGDRLSEFTHGLDIWSVKREEIEGGKQQVPLSEADFSEHDAAVFRDIEQAYPESYIDSVDAVYINGKMFVFYKSDENWITDAVMKSFNEVAYDSKFDSPVYASFDEIGRLALD